MDAPETSQQPMTSEQTDAQQQLVAETRRKVTTFTTYRQPHEGAWYVNAAMLRGQQHVEYDDVGAQLIVPDAPTYATTIDLNKIRPKHRARMAKFFKNRPRPVVIPASTEYQDLMDARATERALRYQWDRLRLELRYRDARLWASICGKSFWWFGYDPMAQGRVVMRGPDNKKMILPGEVGDLTVEVGTAWEVLVADPSKARIGHQPEVLRTRLLDRKDAAARFGGSFESDNADAGTTKEQDKIAGLKADNMGHADTPPDQDKVLLIERYVAPCANYPRGRRIVVCGDRLIAAEDELPFEFWDSPTNPYPCVEFSDGDSPGQFWGTTFIEQLVPIQRMINRTLELVLENAEAVSRPKAIFYTQHNLPDGAYTSAAGEVVTVNYIPGLPEPKIIQAQSVSGDLWNIIQLGLRQMDEVSQLYQANEGGTAGAESGYQTSLLQEAADSVHAPDIRMDELAIEDAAWKMRRIMKLTYDVPRLLTIGGENTAPEMIEFSQRQINDAAEVRIQVGSMLPDLKAAKAQVAMEYYKSGLLGDPADPMVRHRALSLVDIGGYEVVNEKDRLDEDEARRENEAMRELSPVEPAKFNQNHPLHLVEHESLMKRPEWATMKPEAKQALVAHIISHYDFINLPLAMGLRQQFGLLQQPIAAPPPPPPGGPGGAPPQAAGPSTPLPPSGAPAPPTPQTPPLPAA